MTDTIISNEEVVRQLYAEALNKRNFSLLNAFIGDEVVGIRGLKGAAGFEEPVRNLIKGFPDIQWNIQDIVSDGHKVVVRWIWKGTNSGQFQSFASTGKSFSNEGVGIYELKHGKIVDAKILTDRLDFLQQLEVVPYDLSLLVRSTGNDHVSFIDKFFVPATSIGEFLEWMNYNRKFIKTLPGLIKSERYDQRDENGNLVVVTVAVWQNQDYLDQAKAAVQAEFHRIGFDAQDFNRRLNVKMERGIYNSAGE